MIPCIVYSHTEFLDILSAQTHYLKSYDNKMLLINKSDMELDELYSNYKEIIFTGPIDKYFENHKLDKLEYRSIDFKIQRFFNVNYYQPNSVINYPESEYPYTRIVEYKHFLNQKSNHTVIVSETTNDCGEPYYPIPNKRNIELYEKYKVLSEKETIENNIYFVGRLANYKYFNMDDAIDNALEFFNKITKT